MSPPTQEGDPRPCPEGCVSTGNSTIYNHRLSYEHTAMDCQVKDPNQGCQPCGSAPSAGIGGLPSLEILRITRFRGNSQPSSLSPGHSLSYDISFQIYSSANGGSVYLWDPLAEYQYVPKDTTSSGIYTGLEFKSFKDLRLYDANRNPVTP